MRAFVTGANGFVGRHLTTRLAHMRDETLDTTERRPLCAEVVSLERDSHKPSTSGDCTDVVYGDVRDAALMERVLAEYGIDTVFHLAAQVSVATAASDPSGTLDTNVRGTWILLEACRRQKVKRIVVASSDKAYGHAEAPYDETTPLWPDHPYEVSKACADMIAQTYAKTYGMSIAVTRFANFYGPAQPNTSALIPNTILRILRGERPILRGGGRMHRDFVYIADGINAYLELAKSDYVGPMTFGTAKGVEIRHVTDTILRLMKSDLRPEITEEAVGEIRDQGCDYALAQRVLGWKATTSLEDGLREAIAWYRQNLK